MAIKLFFGTFSIIRKLSLTLAVLLVLGKATGQVTLVPTFVTQNDTVEVIFDATQGNGDLVGVAQVYAHTGVITNLSTSPTGWRHVQGNWGTVDPKVQMTNLGNNLHSIKYHINTFYNIPAGETVTALAFVFRNADGSKVGRAAGGGDIFMPISTGGFQAVFSLPAAFAIYDLSDTVDLLAQTSAKADLSLYHGSTLLTQAFDTSSISYKLPLVNYGTGRFDLIFEADDNGTIYRDTVSYLARAGSNIAVDTVGYEEGITILNDSTIALKIRAPYKNFIYVIGDFSDWEITPEFEMYKSPSDPFFWIIIEGLEPNREYGFQYYIDEEGIRVADAYSEKILDGWNDNFIPASVYPNLKPYPGSKTNFPVSVVQTDPLEYQWQTTNYKRPAKEDLVIYELLIRDFDSRHSYRSVIDRLSYLDSLGVNAIELMPVMEFEGNESWGYNPMFFMAPDKYYGTANDLKMLVDSCHARGIAVIMDIAMNHAFGQCPLVRMYFDPSAGQYGEPTAQNPWFNQQPKHDFNVGYDFDHSSDATKYFTKRVFQHWVEEYKIDGYRVDLSKGFTQKNTLGNISAWGQYDQGRINTLQRIKDEVEEVDSNVYMILEHFADNSEEKELASRGFLLWGNMNHAYSEAAMGYSSNLAGVHHSSRGWNEPLLVGYMESHDEERLMYKNLNFGNAGPAYDTKDPSIALERMALTAAFFFTIPGPKMIWQFGELGYDYSINHCPDGTIDPGCRIANKPIRWDYLNDPERRDLFMKYANLVRLRDLYPNVFLDGNYSAVLTGNIRNITLTTVDSAAVVLGNFGLTDLPVTATFPLAGTWYDYTTGDSITITGTFDTTYAPGEYHIYTNFKSERPFNVGLQEQIIRNENGQLRFYPNPTNGPVVLEIVLERKEHVTITLTDLNGRVIRKEDIGTFSSGTHLVPFDINPEGRIAPGVYLIAIDISGQSFSEKVIIQ